MAYKSKHHFRLNKHHECANDSAPGFITFIVGVIIGIVATLFIQDVLHMIKRPATTTEPPKEVAQIEALPPVKEEEQKNYLNEETIYPLFKRYVQERLAVGADLNEQAKRWDVGSFVWALSSKKIYESFVNQEATPLLVIAKAEGFSRSVEVVSMDHHRHKNINMEVWNAIIKMRDQVSTGTDTSNWKVSVIFEQVTPETLKHVAEDPRGKEFLNHNPHGLMIVGFRLKQLPSDVQ